MYLHRADQCRPSSRCSCRDRANGVPVRQCSSTPPSFRGGIIERAKGGGFQGGRRRHEPALGWERDAGLRNKLAASLLCPRDVRHAAGELSFRDLVRPACLPISRPVYGVRAAWRPSSSTQIWGGGTPTTSSCWAHGQGLACIGPSRPNNEEPRQQTAPETGPRSGLLGVTAQPDRRVRQARPRDREPGGLKYLRRSHGGRMHMLEYLFCASRRVVSGGGAQASALVTGGKDPRLLMRPAEQLQCLDFSLGRVEERPRGGGTAASELTWQELLSCRRPCGWFLFQRMAPGPGSKGSVLVLYSVCGCVCLSACLSSSRQPRKEGRESSMSRPACLAGHRPGPYQPQGADEVYLAGTRHGDGNVGDQTFRFQAQWKGPVNGVPAVR